MCVVTAFGNEEPHYRGSEASDDVQQDYVPHSFLHRPHRPGSMVYSHSNNRHELQGISGKTFLFFFHDAYSNEEKDG